MSSDSSEDIFMLDDRLEAVVHGASSSDYIAVLGHPHPKFGGSMANNVVAALHLALRRCGLATLRFNTRGVGRSLGSASWRGVAERDDFRAAIRHAQRLKGADRVLLVAYSFSAAVGLSVAPEFPLAAVVAVGYPYGFTSSMLFSSHYVDPGPAPKLFVLGDRDNFTSAAALSRVVEQSVAQPKKLVLLEGGVDHFFFGCESLIVQQIIPFLMDLDIIPSPSSSSD